MKAIQKELGEMDDAPNEIDELQTKINDARMPGGTRESQRRTRKLKMMSPCQPRLPSFAVFGLDGEYPVVQAQ